MHFVITTTGLVGVEVQCYNNGRPTGQKQLLFDGKMVENKGKLILIGDISLSCHANKVKLRHHELFVLMSIFKRMT